MKHNTIRLVQALLATVLLACGLQAAASHVSPLLNDTPVTSSKALGGQNCISR